MLGKESFGRALKNCPEASNIHPQRRRVTGEITYGWQGIGVISPTGLAPEGEGAEGRGDTEEPSDDPDELKADIPF